jgi:hypothetical protein
MPLTAQQSFRWKSLESTGRWSFEEGQHRVAASRKRVTDKKLCNSGIFVTARKCSRTAGDGAATRNPALELTVPHDSQSTR